MNPISTHGFPFKNGNLLNSHQKWLVVNVGCRVKFFCNFGCRNNPFHGPYLWPPTRLSFLVANREWSFITGRGDWEMGTCIFRKKSHNLFICDLEELSSGNPPKFQASSSWSLQGCPQAIAHSDCAIYSNKLRYLLFQNHCRITGI